MNNRKITYILTIIISISFLTSIFLISERHKKEETFKNVELMVGSQDLETLAYANNMKFEEVLEDFKDVGITSIISREKTLGDLERTGEAILMKDSGRIYLQIVNEDYQEQVEQSVLSKNIGRIKMIEGKKVIDIPSKIPSFYSFDEGYMDVIDKIGIGFNHKQVEMINKKGLYIVPQIRSWKNYTPESFDFVDSELDRMNNVSILLSNDSSVVGYSGNIDSFLEEVNPNKEIPVGMVEFFNQVGLNQIVYKNDMNAVRIHSISDKEMLNFTEEKAIDRYMLSAEERNIRGIYLKMFYLDNPMNAYDSNLNYVSRIVENLNQAGFTLGEASIINHEKENIAFYMIVTLGLLAGVWMIFIKLGTPIFGIASAIAVAFLIAASFVINSMLSLKITALLFVLVYPVLAFTSVLDDRENTKEKNIMSALKNTVIISVITFAGGLMMSSMLSFTPFMLKTDQFAGVKVAHLIPLLVIPFFLIFWNKEGFSKIKELLNKAIEYKVALIGAIGAAALGYYLLRTGNQGASLVLGIEEQFREALDYYLGVRPRTKEFIIGYPFLMLLTYLGLNKKTWPLLFPAIIGQISLANTYAHIHTPISISLQRSTLGLMIGLLLGVVLIIAWKIMEILYEKYSN